MGYNMDKDNADVLSVFSKLHPLDRKATNDSKADSWNQSSSSNQERGLPGSSLITSGSSGQNDRNDPREHGEDNDDNPGTIRACLDVEHASTPTGAKAFTALKGAMDKGPDDSHTEKGSLGYDIKPKPLNNVHKEYTFGQQVNVYMRDINFDENPVSTKGMYTKTHRIDQDEGDKKTIQPSGETQETLVRTYEPEEFCEDANRQHCHKIGTVVPEEVCDPKSSRIPNFGRYSKGKEEGEDWGII